MFGTLFLGTFGLLLVLALVLTTFFSARGLVAHRLHLRGFELFDVGGARPPIGRQLGARAAGIVAAWLSVWLLAFAETTWEGEDASTTRVEVLPGPAADAGLQSGDRIVELDHQPIADFAALKRRLRDRPGQRRIVVDRASQPLELWVTPRSDSSIGVRSMLERRSLPLWAAARQALDQTLILPKLLVEALFSDRRAMLTGPVGIVQATRGSASPPWVTGFARLVVGVASFAWGLTLLVELLDLGTRHVFLWSHPAARSASADGERDSWRIARMRQLLHLLVLAWLVVACWGAFQDLGGRPPGPGFELYGPLFFTVFPLVFCLASALGGRYKGAAYTAALVVPVFNLVVLWYLSRSARSVLRKRGFVVGLLTARPSPDLPR